MTSEENATARAPFHVNLPVRYILRTPHYVDRFVAKSIHPEIGIDSHCLDTLDLGTHQQIAQRFHDAGLTCSVHLPFADLHPGSEDDLILDATRRRLDKALRIARLYSPTHLITHPHIQPHTLTDVAREQHARRIETYRRVILNWPDHPPLYFENTREPTPNLLPDLLTALSTALPATYSGTIGICFDIGHWHAFSHGHRNADLGRWMLALSPWLAHLHLHDNTGMGDEHLGLGQGSIPLDQLASLLQELHLTPTVTLEPHSEEAFSHSLRYLSEHPLFTH